VAEAAPAEDAIYVACLVLLSGGIDSATLLAHACQTWPRVESLFVDYGQAAADGERAAAQSFAAAAGVDHREVSFAGPTFGAGEIRGRNAFLIHAALLAWPEQAGAIALGIHGHSVYRDCSPEFASLMQQSLDLHTAGAVQLSTPFITWTKGEVFSLALELGISLDLTYCCEASGTAPCGTCESCRDRDHLLASA
jgi:7-cyano-7-deazaguanine synthase